MFKMTLKSVLIAALIGVGGAGMAYAAGGDPVLDKLKKEATQHKHWGFNGVFGTYDKQAMQRGFQVYREVCAACHGLEYLDFRHLGDPGGPFYMEDFPNPNDNPLVKGIAAEYLISDIDGETGDVITRPGIPADEFPPVFPNKVAAAASNNGVAPPDLSVMVKARTDGANYMYSLLTAYDKYEQPESIKLGAGQYFNPVMEGGVIAMAPPLVDGIIEYEGENAPEATVSQMAKDVTYFLAWSADPKLEQRKRVGFATLMFLSILTILLYLSYKQVWKGVKH